MAGAVVAQDGEQQAPEPHSPIGRLLESLGMTREDLERHSAHMREFLTTENANSLRVLVHSQDGPQPGSSATSKENALSSSQSLLRSQSMSDASMSRASSVSGHAMPPPMDCSTSRRLQSHPTKLSPRDTGRRERREKRGRNHGKCGMGSINSSSPIKPKPSLDEVMQMRSSRVSRRVSVSPESEESDEDILPDDFRSRTNVAGNSPHYRTGPYVASGQLDSAFTLDGGLSVNLSPATWNTPSGKSQSYYRPESPSPQADATSQGDLHNMHKAVSVAGSSDSTQDLQQSQTITPTRQSHYRTNYNYSGALPSSSSPASATFPDSCYSEVATSAEPPFQPPIEHIQERLPFVLPPGPYSEEKPDLSYAAMIGRAILASPAHRLRLKDIYEYIATVFPHYVRGEGTSHSHKWMNAIRQNLTNTPQFHKVASETTKGGSYWHVRDEDLLCFANGGYKRSAVAAYTNTDPSSFSASSSAPKRKRKRDDEQRQKVKKNKPEPAPPRFIPNANPYHFPYPMMSNVYYHHPTSIVPPSSDDGALPPSSPPSTPTSNYRASICSSSQMQVLSSSPEPDCLSEPPPSSSASSISVPDLTPNCSSSSPPLPYEFSQADMCVDVEDSDEAELLCPEATNHQAAAIKAYGLEPGIQLMDNIPISFKGKGVDRSLPLPPLAPSTPTVRRKSRTTAQQQEDDYLDHVTVNLSDITEYSTRFSPTRPSTPPPHLAKHPFSSLRTPVQQTGRSQNTLFTINHGDEADAKTPSRLLTRSPPITPRKLPSPFSFSPFKTPTRGRLFDPHNPSMMLDEELTRLSTLQQASGLGESPVGFFGHGKGLLYESPSFPSPAQWRQTW